jgi:hypothetical protein
MADIRILIDDDGDPIGIAMVGEPDPLDFLVAMALGEMFGEPQSGFMTPTEMVRRGLMPMPDDDTESVVTTHRHKCKGKNCKTVWRHDPRKFDPNPNAYVDAHKCPKCGLIQSKIYEGDKQAAEEYDFTLTP